MSYKQLSVCLLILITVSITMSAAAAASRQGGKIHFQDSSELEELDIDKRPGPHRDDRNHRGRAKFEEGIPDVYPIRGSPQAPLVLPTTADKAVPASTSPQPVQLPWGHHYAGNPFLAKYQTTPTTTATTATNNKYNPPILPGITNQLPSSDKPATTTPSNARLTNSLEADAKAETSTDISFKDRGLFDTAPHCQPGQILVNNKCRMAV